MINMGPNDINRLEVDEEFELINFNRTYRVSQSIEGYFLETEGYNFAIVDELEIPIEVFLRIYGEDKKESIQRDYERKTGFPWAPTLESIHDIIKIMWCYAMLKDLQEKDESVYVDGQEDPIDETDKWEDICRIEEHGVLWLPGNIKYIRRSFYWGSPDHENDYFFNVTGLPKETALKYYSNPRPLDGGYFPESNSDFDILRMGEAMWLYMTIHLLLGGDVRQEAPEIGQQPHERTAHSIRQAIMQSDDE
jgi:hypothetical protein